MFFKVYLSCSECVVCGRCGAPLVSLEPHTCSPNYAPRGAEHLAWRLDQALDPSNTLTTDAQVVRVKRNR